MSDDSAVIRAMCDALLALRVARTDESWKRYRCEDSWGLFLEDARTCLAAYRKATEV